MLFQGEEWGAATPFLYFTDHADPDLGAGCDRRPAPGAPCAGGEGSGGPEAPDPQAAATFERSRLDWSELGREPHRSLLAWYRALIALRVAEPDLRGDGASAQVSYDEDARWLIMRRGRFGVAANFSDRPRALRLGEPGTVLMSSGGPVVWEGERLSFSPRSVAIVAH